MLRGAGGGRLFHAGDKIAGATGTKQALLTMECFVH
jgi:hypothetical protein